MSEERKEILERFARLEMLLHRFQAHNFINFGPWANPQRGQGRILSILKMKPEMSQKELSYLLDMSKQALAELLNKLEKNGFIKREPSKEDRRSFDISLTQEGAAVADKMEDAPLEPTRVFDCLSEEELSNLNNYLKRIIERFEEQFTGEDEDLRRRMIERFIGRHERRCGDR